MITSVNEVYVGKTKEINDMFLTFSLARRYYMDDKAAKGMKELGKLETQIEKYFGFGSFSIDITGDSVMNAYTFPITTSIDIDPSSVMISTSKGYKFNPKANICALSRITKGLFCNYNLTNGECFAIFLHEIGHSFVNRSPAIDALRDVYVGQLIMSLVMQAILDLLMANPMGLLTDADSILKCSNLGKMVSAQCAKLQKKIPVYRTIKWYASRLLSAVSNGINSIVYIVLSLTGLPYILNKINQSSLKQYRSNKDKKNPQAFGRAQERLSDDFATMYGFGAELASGLIKIENRGNSIGWNDMIYDIPGIKAILKGSEAAGIEYGYTFGVHPHAADRVLKIMENMEYEINKDKKLTDKERKALKLQLKEVKKVVDDGKKLEGELGRYPDRTRAAYINLGFIKGSSEDDEERKYTDMKTINDRYREIKEIANSIDIDDLDNIENFNEQYDRELKKLYF